MDLLTGIGLALPAGLNAYIPLLMVSIAQHFGFMELAAPYDMLGDWWVMGAVAVLLVIEIVADKVPAVDHINDIIQTIVRPAAGGLLAVASSGSVESVHPALMALVGVVMAGGMHATKSMTRVAANGSTLGVSAPFLSIGEDINAVIMTVIALVAPVLVVVVLIVCIIVFIKVKRKASLVKLHMKRQLQRRRSGEVYHQEAEQ